jgi:transcriptional regulator
MQGRWNAAGMSAERFLYAPDAYVATNPADIVRRYPFALLITTGPAGLLASSAPLFFETDSTERAMIGHLARANPQAASLAAGQNALAIFCGPHAYISSSWYREKPTVPTWNYLSAHVRGTLVPIDDDARQLEVLRRTAAVMEHANTPPWTLEDAPPGRVEFLLPKIRSFRFSVEQIEGVTKLSQTHPPADRQRVIKQLRARDGDGDAAIARLMSALELTQ